MCVSRPVNGSPLISFNVAGGLQSCWRSASALTSTSSAANTLRPGKAWHSMLSQDDKRLTPAECQREAMRYAGQAYTEPQVGMRSALLNVARSWQEIAAQIERLE